MAETALPYPEPRKLVLEGTPETPEKGLPWPGTLSQWGTEPDRPGLLELFQEPSVIMGHLIPHLKPPLFVKRSCNLVESLLQEEVTSCKKFKGGSICVALKHLLKVSWAQMLRQALGRQGWGEHSPFSRGAHSRGGNAQGKAQKLRYSVSKGSLGAGEGDATGQEEAAPSSSGESQGWGCLSWELKNEFAKHIEEVGVGAGMGIPHRGDVAGGRGRSPSRTCKYG